jgi:Holliday junction DNA helicase RuvA
MIAFLAGKIITKHDQAIVVLVNDVGYLVHAVPDILVKPIDTQVELHIHHVVREDSQDLYGFITEQELLMFKTLISVSGVGPKTALGILSVTSVNNLKNAVASGDVKLLTTFSGIGKKTAERLLVELKDKIMIFGLPDEKSVIAGSEDMEVLAALEQFGYSAMDARKAIIEIPKEISGVEARLKAALKQLGTR